MIREFQRGMAAVARMVGRMLVVCAYAVAGAALVLAALVVLAFVLATGLAIGVVLFAISAHQYIVGGDDRSPRKLAPP